MTSDPGYDENLRDFLAEATEHVESLNQLMLKLEDMVTSGLDLDILNTMFRNAHSLKGMSGMMGFTRLNGLTHKMENILDLLRNGQLAPDANLIEVLFASFDALNDLINEIRAGQGEQRDVTELLARISQVSGAAAPDTSAPEPAEKQLTISPELKPHLSLMDEINLMVALNGGDHLYEIGLRLDRDCFDHGIAPRELYADLEALGEIVIVLPLTVLPGSLESFSAAQFDFEIRLLLATGKGQDELGAALGSADIAVREVTLAEPVPAGLEPVAAVAPPALPDLAAVNPEYLRVFIEESGEDVLRLNEALISYEKDPADRALLNTIFRHAHKMKSASAAVGLAALADLLHRGESVLDLLRSDRLAVNDRIISLLLQMADIVTEAVTIIKAGGVPDIDSSAVASQLALLCGAPLPAASAPPAADDRRGGADRRAGERRETTPPPGGPGERRTVSGETIRVDVERLDELMNLTGELVINRARILTLINSLKNAFERKDLVFALDDVLFRLQALEQAAGQAEAADGRDGGCVKLAAGVAQTVRGLQGINGQMQELLHHRQQVAQLADAAQHLTRLSTKIQNGVMQARMLPIGQIFRKFTRLVRDLAKGANKKIRLEIHGEDTELDKSVLDELNDPLTHLLRNSLDHGVETPAARLAAGKPEEGCVTLNAYHSGNRVCIEIRDDGKGINLEAVRRKALERGVVTEAELAQLSEREIVNLIFLPGFSTAEKVTDLSGRGVGMDVVRHQVEKLSGSVEIISRPGEGTTTILSLPLTLAIIDAMLFRVGGELYAIPIENTSEVISIAPDSVHTIEGNETITLRDQTLSVVHLDRVIGSAARAAAARTASVLVINDGSRRLGLFITGMLGKEEVVVKPLAGEFDAVGGISGATILGDGTVALILDAEGIIRQATRRTGRREGA